MNPVRVGVVGYDRLGKRVADAVRLQPDMVLAGVAESDPVRLRLLRHHALPSAADDLADWAAGCDVLVDCRGGLPPLPVPVVHVPGVAGAGVLYGPGTPGERLAGRPDVRVACADAVALLRLLAALAQWQPFTRLFSSCACRAAHATEHHGASIDALEPVFAEPAEDADLEELLRRHVAEWHVRRTRVPYTHSHLHMIKLDCVRPPAPDVVRAALRSARRVLTSAVARGLTDTGQLQEHFRDVGRPWADRPEVFVWEESVAVTGNSLVLMADVGPEATPVPDVIDAVRYRCRPSVADAAGVTDRALGLRR
jgi:glyceraldehyde-3-phosphate dehydrogenase (NAD(P))